MCTLSWLITEQGFDVFFNRDEKKSRPTALAPRFNEQKNAIYPLDPVGGGTWLALTVQGTVFCLLNNYQAKNTQLMPENSISRGLVIPKLIERNDEVLKSNLLDLTLLSKTLPLKNMSPFILCYFPSKVTNDNDIQVINWDGDNLSDNVAISPIVSSGFDLTGVSKNRLASYSDDITDQKQHLAFHCSHQPERSAYSVCMHREDAHTVSFTHIQVRAENSLLHYTDDAPCLASASSISFILER